MRENIYFYLFILCGIWSHSIIRTFAAEETIKESSDVFVRHKRVVSHVPSEDIKVTISSAKYVVIIKNYGRIKCTGSILSTRIVITAASCTKWGSEGYQIVFATATTYRGRNHDVIDIRKNLAIALLATKEPFVYNAFSHEIQLHVDPLLPGTIGQISGWGYNFRSSERGTNAPEHLRTIQVPIISHQDCVNRYRPYIAITNKEVCTFHPQRHSGHTDFGAGLVVNGRLAGVFLWSGVNQNGINSQYPDVFANLQDSEYKEWITSSMRAIHRLLEMYD